MLTHVSCRSITLSVKLLRVPSIKFRYGSGREQKSAASTSTSSSNKSSVTTSGREVIFDFQLPLRFKRKPLEQEEIDYINRGGPA